MSFKEKGSLQLAASFAKKDENGQLASDIDIDLLTDIGHFGEVSRTRSHNETDPFSI